MKRISNKFYHKTSWSGASLLIVLVFFLSYCQNKEAKAPDDVIEVTTVQMQPDIYFHQAITDFTNQDYDKSSENIRKAINIIDSIALKADTEQKEKLKNSVELLSELQTNVANDKVDGVEDLNYCFARAGQALAGYHMHIYKTEYYNLEGKKASEELKKAIDFIETSVAFNDHEFDAEELALLNELKNQTELLKGGQEISKAEIEALLTKLNDHMAKWGNDIEVNYRKFQDTQKTVIHNKI